MCGRESHAPLLPDFASGFKFVSRYGELEANGRRSVTNTTPAIVKVTLEVFRDQSLLWTIRDSLKDAINSTTVLSFDIKKLENKPHLLSVYAETLRLIVQVYITGYARDSDLKINNWILPKAKVAMVNTWLAHRDENVWNTKQGTHPLDQFWAERFLIDPKDPSSGPLRKTSPEISQNATKEDDSSADEPRFSMDGLEGAWIPYGGKSWLLSSDSTIQEG